MTAVTNNKYFTVSSYSKAERASFICRKTVSEFTAEALSALRKRRDEKKVITDSSLRNLRVLCASAVNFGLFSTLGFL
jgi:hypothetical protein